MKPGNERVAEAWKQREADWARLGFIDRKKRSAYRVPKDLLVPGECPCGAMLSEHHDELGMPVTCDTLRYARASAYVNGGAARKALQATVIQRVKLQGGQS